VNSCRILNRGLALAVFTVTAAILGTPRVALAGTVVSGIVSGIWDLAGSPYWVEGDLLVGASTSLAIEPGVEVRFRGPYRLLIQGLLTAAGTESDSILFTWDQPLPAHEWHGIRLVGADSATLLEYCRIERVRSVTSFPDVRGGAIYCEGCSPSIKHCLLQHSVSHNGNSNGMGGGVACVEAGPLIESCVIRQNQADSGGGITTIEYGSAVIRNNLIRDNTAPYCGGGIYAGVRSSPVIENNLILDNRAYGWGGGGITLWNWYAMNFISKMVRNNVVAGNYTSAAGGGFYIRYDYSVLENNTVADNTAGQGGGAYVLNQGPGDYPPDLHDFILWGNSAATGPAIHPDPTTGSAVVVAYCDVEGGWTGTGNINAPPVYEGEAYRLAPASPGVDGGDPSPVFDDLCFPPSQGTARNDMGAYGGPLACQWPGEFSSVPPGPVTVDRTPCAEAGAFILAPTVAVSAELPVSFGWVRSAPGGPGPGGPARLVLFSVAGRQERLIYVGLLGEQPQTRRVPLQGLPAGCYYLRLQTPLGDRVRPLRVVR
jgi:parallel beta-helix repeat protein